MRSSPRTLRGAAAALGLLALSCGAQQAPKGSTPPASTTFFPLSEVHAGLQGTGFTVFEGTRPEAFAVEILGVLRNALGANRDMILARLHGPKPEYTGVVAGMSGSPVYIDGRLVGALSYRIGQFSKDPIAGITPITQMLEVRDQPAPLSLAPTSAGANGPEMRAIESPLTFSGFGKDAVDRFGDRFRALGLMPVAGLGGMDATKAQPEPLLPGSAVSAVLAEGDLSITGTCTVSYVDPKRLLACGHPITQFGAVDMPMAKAEVVATLASPLNSFKIVNATEIAGAFTEDRASAILGHFGAHADMIPLDIHVAPSGDAQAERTIRVRILRNRQLTPQVMMVSLFQALQESESGTAETSYHVQGQITLDEVPEAGVAPASPLPAHALPPVRLDEWATPSDFASGAVAAALRLGDSVDQLYAATGTQPFITGVHVDVAAVPHRNDLTLESSRLDRSEARPGDSITVEATLRPSRGQARTVRERIALPSSLTAGTLRLLVSDGATLNRLQASAAAKALSLGDTVARLNAQHSNSRLYITLLDRSAQAALESGSLGDVPLSMANVLEPLKDQQRMRLTGESLIELGSTALDGALTGSQLLSLTVQ